MLYIYVYSHMYMCNYTCLKPTSAPGIGLVPKLRVSHREQSGNRK